MFKIQSTLITNIQSYLKDESSKSEERKEELKSLNSYFQKSTGECAGFSTLWSFIKQLELRSKQSQGAKAALDNLKESFDILGSYDEIKDKLSLEQKQNIEKFISNLQYYQYRVGSTRDTDGLIGIFKDEILGKPEKAFNYSVISTEEGFASIIEKILIKSNMVLLGTFKTGHTAHATSLFRNEDGSISFYNPNSDEYNSKNYTTFELFISKLWGELQLNRAGEELGHFSSNFDIIQSYLKQFAIQGFNFNKENTEYPSSEEITKEASKGYQDTVNSLSKFPFKKIDAETEKFILSLPIKELFNNKDIEEKIFIIKLLTMLNGLPISVSEDLFTNHLPALLKGVCNMEINKEFFYNCLKTKLSYKCCVPGLKRSFDNIGEQEQVFLMEALIKLNLTYCKNNLVELFSYFAKNNLLNVIKFLNKNKIYEKELQNILVEGLKADHVSIRELFPSGIDEGLKTFWIKFLVNSSEIPPKSFMYLCIKDLKILKNLVEIGQINKKLFDTLLQKAVNYQSFIPDLFENKEIYELSPKECVTHFGTKYAYSKILFKDFPTKLDNETKIFLIKHLANNIESLPNSIAFYLLKSHPLILKDLVDKNEIKDTILMDLEKYNFGNLRYILDSAESKEEKSLLIKLIKQNYHPKDEENTLLYLNHIEKDFELQNLGEIADQQI